VVNSSQGGGSKDTWIVDTNGWAPDGQPAHASEASTPLAGMGSMQQSQSGGR
jgi:hypothetical protein